MSDDFPDPALTARVRENFARQGLMQTLGAELIHISPGRCRIAAPIHSGVSQQNGFAHAGFTFSIADSAAGYAALSLMPEGADVLGIEMKINLLAPAVGQRLIADATVVRAGRKIHVLQADISTEGGPKGPKQVALLQGTAMVMQPDA